MSLREKALKALLSLIPGLANLRPVERDQANEVVSDFLESVLKNFFEKKAKEHELNLQSQAAVNNLGEYNIDVDFEKEKRDLLRPYPRRRQVVVYKCRVKVEKK